MRQERNSTFGSRLVECKRNMADRTWQKVGANRAELPSALEAVAANIAQLVAQENAAFEQRGRALSQTMREEFDGCRAHFAAEKQEGIPAHTEVRDFFRGQFYEGARRVELHAHEHYESNVCSASARGGTSRVDPALRDPARLTKHVFKMSWCELDTARSTPSGCGR